MPEFDKITIAKELRRIINRINYSELPIEERNELLERYFFIMEDAERNNININEGMRLYENYRKRNQRLRKRISNIIECDSLFLTFTFTDEVLAKTNQDTRQQYVRRFLKSISKNYVANIDFGGKFGREHFHAVCIVSEKVDYTSWKYGALNGERVRKNSSPLALAKYVNKLVYHATKETTAQRLIFSKKK